MNKQEEHKYDDMINLPHHISKKHPQMSLLNRAAQFSPFAALTGHEDIIREKGCRNLYDNPPQVQNEDG